MGIHLIIALPMPAPSESLLIVGTFQINFIVSLSISKTLQNICREDPELQSLALNINMSSVFAADGHIHVSIHGFVSQNVHSWQHPLYVMCLIFYVLDTAI